MGCRAHSPTTLTKSRYAPDFSLLIRAQTAICATSLTTLPLTVFLHVTTFFVEIAQIRAVGMPMYESIRQPQSAAHLQHWVIVPRELLVRNDMYMNAQNSMKREYAPTRSASYSILSVQDAGEQLLLPLFMKKSRELLRTKRAVKSPVMRKTTMNTIATMWILTPYRMSTLSAQLMLLMKERCNRISSNFNLVYS
jgi:hypothetical protein